MSTHEPLTLAVPGSKSVTHRAFLLGALSSAPCRVRGPLLGADCRSTLSVLKALGADFAVDGADVVFQPIDGLRPSGGAPLDCGNSGTTLRLLSGQVARLAAAHTLTGDASLQSRPNGPLLAALTALGARVDSHEGRAPLTIEGPIEPGEVELPPKVSSQYGSSILLAAALMPGATTLRMARPVASRPYLELTRSVADAFGLTLPVVEAEDALVFPIKGGQQPRRAEFAVEGDWSGAAFPLVAAALTAQPLRLTGLRRASEQGDQAIAEIVASFGPQVSWTGDVLCLGPAPLAAPAPIDLGPTPDLFPPLCALAACAEGTTRLFGAPSLRHKECDRIAAMAEGLTRLGVECVELPDGIEITGGRPKVGAAGGRTRSFHDHRIYMSFSVLGLVTEGEVEPADRGCEAVSYPEFHAHRALLAERV